MKGLVLRNVHYTFLERIEAYAMSEVDGIQRDDVAVLKGRGATVFIALGAAAASALGFHKASPDDPVHPGWPAGMPGGLGGKFRPKDGTAAGEAAVKRLAQRRAVRTLLL